MIPWLNKNDPFPDVNTALTAKDGYAGLLAVGADLSPKRLLEAYRSGIFPWYSDGEPVLWWSTDPRMVLFTDEFKISASLKKKLRQIEKSMLSNGIWQLCFDGDFEAVIRACAEPRNGRGTWITEDMINAYCKLHNMGFAHSVELRHEGKLVGGAYGVSIGRMFFGESMFSRISDASKIALAALVYFLKSNGVLMIDCQQETEHLASLGARPISRNDFIAHIRQAVNYPQLENWFVEKIF